MAEPPSQPPGWPFDDVPEPPPGAPRFEPPVQPAAPVQPPGAPRFEPPVQPAAPVQPPPAPAPAYQPPPPVQPPPAPAPAYQPPPPAPAPTYPPPAPGQPHQPPAAAYQAPPPAQAYPPPYEPPIPSQPPAPYQQVPPPNWNPTAPPKKNRKPLWITLGVIFAVLALGIGSCTFWFVGTVRAPVDEANRFLALVDQGDYATAAATTDPSCNFGLTAAALEETFRGGDISYDLKSSSIVNSDATVSGSFSSATASYRNIMVTLRKSGGEWRVCGLQPS